jgi:cytochrome c
LNLLNLFLALALALAQVHRAPAATERGTAEQARSMLEKAVGRYRAVGRAQALAEFNAETPPFADRDLYVMCVGADHLITANGGFPGLVGVTADVLKDVGGRPLGQLIWETPSIKGVVSVRYAGMNPVSRASELKTTLFRKVGDDMCGVGVYDPP